MCRLLWFLTLPEQSKKEPFRERTVGILKEKKRPGFIFPVSVKHGSRPFSADRGTETVGVIPFSAAEHGQARKGDAGSGTQERVPFFRRQDLLPERSAFQMRQSAGNQVQSSFRFARNETAFRR